VVGIPHQGGFVELNHQAQILWWYQNIS